MIGGVGGLLTNRLLPDPAQKVLDAFTAGYPKSWIADKGSLVGGAALVLHTLLARVGPHAPIPEAVVGFVVVGRCLVVPSTRLLQRAHGSRVPRPAPPANVRTQINCRDR